MDCYLLLRVLLDNPACDLHTEQRTVHNNSVNFSRLTQASTESLFIDSAFSLVNHPALRKLYFFYN